MNAFLAVIRRDLKLALRNFGDTLTLLMFFLLVGIVVPFAIGPDKALLARLAPGLVWIAAMLSFLLSLDRLFRIDRDDGTLLIMRHAAIPLEAIAFAKLFAHWLTTALPLLAATPVLAVLFNMELSDLWRTLLSLLLGTPALAALGAIGASLTVSLRRGGLIAPVLILPLSVPILIFGVGAIDSGATIGAERAAMLILSGLSIAAVALAPFAAALALKLADE